MPVNKKYIDKSSGIDEQIAETNQTNAYSSRYAGNIANWMMGGGRWRPENANKKYMVTADGDVYEPPAYTPGYNQPYNETTNAINKSYNQNLSQLEQWRSEQYGEQQKAYEKNVGKLNESLTKSIASGRKSLESYNKQQREQAKYDISQAYQYYLQQQQSIGEATTLSEGSRAYLETQAGEATTTAKAKVEQSLEESLNTAQTQFEENVAEATANVEDRKAELKETYESNLAEIDKTFETNKESLDSMKDSSFNSAAYQKALTTNVKDYNTSVTETTNLFNSYASNDDIEKGIDKVKDDVTKLQSDYEKADALATKWENKASTAAEKSYAKSLRAIANNAKKLYEEGVKQLNTFKARAYTYESDKIAIKEKIRKEFENSAIYDYLKADYEGDTEGLQNLLYTKDGELTEAGKEMYATYLFNNQTGFANPLQKLGLTQQQIYALLGIDSEKYYPEQNAEYLANKSSAKNTVDKLPNADYVGYVKYTDDGKSFYVDGTKYDINSLTKIPDDSLSVSEDDIAKIPAGTVFSSTIKSSDDWYNDDTVKTILTGLGLTKPSSSLYSMAVGALAGRTSKSYYKTWQYSDDTSKTSREKLWTEAQNKKAELEKLGFTVEVVEEKEKVWSVFSDRKTNINLVVTGYSPKALNYYKSSDGNIYYLD